MVNSMLVIWTKWGATLKSQNGGEFDLHTPALKGGTRVPKHVQNSILGNLLVLAR